MRACFPAMLPSALALALLAAAGPAAGVGVSTHSIITDFRGTTDLATGGPLLERSLEVPGSDPQDYSFSGYTSARADLFVNPLVAGKVGTQAELGVRTHIEAGHVPLPGTSAKAVVEAGASFADLNVYVPVPPQVIGRPPILPGVPVTVTMIYSVGQLGFLPQVILAPSIISPTESYARLTGSVEFGGNQIVATDDFHYVSFGGGSVVHRFTLPVGSYFHYNLSFVAHLMTDPVEANKLGLDQLYGYFGTIGHIDFLHTARITSIAFADAAGNPLSGLGLELQLSDGSFLVPSAVPEPASALLLAAGLLALGPLVRRRRTNGR